LYQIPGVKFRLSEEKCWSVWTSLGRIFNSFCLKYGLTPYEYVKITEGADDEKWAVSVIEYLVVIIPSIPKELAVMIIDCLLGELKTYQSFSWSKKLSLFALILWYSAYLDKRSRFPKIFYIAQRIGVIQFSILAVLYKTHQRKYQKNNFAEQQQ